MADWSGKAVHEFLGGEGSVLSMGELATRYLRQKDRAEKAERNMATVRVLLGYGKREGGFCLNCIRGEVFVCETCPVKPSK